MRSTYLPPSDRRCDDPFQRRVWAALSASAGHFPSLGEVAGELCVSVRTLKRRLRKHGLSYRRLLDELRLNRGAQLLAQPGLSLDVIAVHTGYSSAANFSRAFIRWSGESPGVFRRRVVGTNVESISGRRPGRFLGVADDGYRADAVQGMKG